jgi:hypothetical protein
VKDLWSGLGGPAANGLWAEGRVPGKLSAAAASGLEPGHRRRTYPGGSADAWAVGVFLDTMRN